MCCKLHSRVAMQCKMHKQTHVFPFYYYFSDDRTESIPPSLSACMPVWEFFIYIMNILTNFYLFSRITFYTRSQKYTYLLSWRFLGSLFIAFIPVFYLNNALSLKVIFLLPEEEPCLCVYKPCNHHERPSSSIHFFLLTFMKHQTIFVRIIDNIYIPIHEYIT